MKIVKESISFKRNENSYDALGIGTLNSIHKAKIKSKFGQIDDLIYCVVIGNIEWVKFLIENDININEDDKYLALLYAVNYDKEDIVKYLINIGIDINAKYKETGLTALENAIKSNYTHNITLLKKYGAK